MTRLTFVFATLLAALATASVLPTSLKQEYVKPGPGVNCERNKNGKIDRDDGILECKHAKEGTGKVNTKNSNPRRNGNGDSDGGADGENERARGGRGRNDIDTGNNNNVQDGDNDGTGGDGGSRDIDIDGQGSADQGSNSVGNTPVEIPAATPAANVAIESGIPAVTGEPIANDGLTNIGDAVPPTSGFANGASTGENNTANATCFPASAMLVLESGRSIKMSELLIGDRVSVGGGKYSQVFMFTHKLPSVRAEFLEITTASGRAIRLTAGHFLPVNSVYADAADVVVGDSLELEDGAHSQVTSVQLVSDKGLYNPQTVHGDIAVNGVRASVYTKAVAPVVAHAMLSPLRLAFSRFGFVTEALLSGSKLADFVPNNGGCFNA